VIYGSYRLVFCWVQDAGLSAERHFCSSFAIRRCGFWSAREALETVVALSGVVMLNPAWLVAETSMILLRW
jgi:hypothetical protein